VAVLSGSRDVDLANNMQNAPERPGNSKPAVAYELHPDETQVRIINAAG